ncbi:MAG: phosphomannomutase, partial [Nitrosopumilus sp.]
MKISISGIRGIFGKDLTLKDVLRFCNNFSTLVKSKNCVIAHDTRPSSSIIVETASAALMQCGINVYNLGMVPTPVIFRESRKYAAGIIVTSSHNPIEWNGLKFIVNGRGINEQELKTIVNEQDTSKSVIGVESKIESKYIDEAANLIGKVSGTPKVVVDIGGGAAKNVAPTLLEKIGCQVKIINENLDKCSRGPDPTADDLKDLISNCNGSIGFAFDLDGDRLVIVKDGKKLSPDVTLGLGIAKALEMGYKKFVLSIDSSVSVEKFIQENGGEVQRSKVGEANVIDLMLKTKSQAGGEGSSGGFILPEFNYCRDGILTSGLIVSMLEKK